MSDTVPAYIFQGDRDQTVIFGQYQIFRKSPAVYCAMNEVTDSFSGKEGNVRTLKILSGMSVHKGISLWIYSAFPGKCPLLLA